MRSCIHLSASNTPVPLSHTPLTSSFSPFGQQRSVWDREKGAWVMKTTDRKQSINTWSSLVKWSLSKRQNPCVCCCCQTEIINNPGWTSLDWIWRLQTRDCWLLANLIQTILEQVQQLLEMWVEFWGEEKWVEGAFSLSLSDFSGNALHNRGLWPPEGSH